MNARVRKHQVPSWSNGAPAIRVSAFGLLSAFGLRVSAFRMSTAPRKLTLDEWDARYAELQSRRPA